MIDRPSTLPPGLRVELSRHQVIPGQSAKVDEWMKMFNDRADECRATLDPERVAVEAIFRLRDDHGEWLYWFELAGDEGTGLTEERAIDRDHIAHARQATVPGHLSAAPEVLLLPLPSNTSSVHGLSTAAMLRHAAKVPGMRRTVLLRTGQQP